MRSLSIFTLLVASASFASASIITNTCSATPNTGGAGLIGSYGSSTNLNTVSYSCSSFTAPVGQQIIAVSLLGRADYSFGDATVNSFTMNISGYSLAGFANFSSSASSGPGGGDSSINTPGSTAFTGSLPINNPTAFAAFTATGTGSAVGGFGSSNGRLQVQYTYEVIPSGVPEPSTLAFVGSVLVLAGIRKFRR